MKTTLSKIALAMALSISFVTCTKEKQDLSIQTKPITDDQLLEKVNWFSNAANDLKDGKYLKTSEKMFIDDAVYSISASLNLNYGFPELILTNTKLVVTTVDIPVISTEGKAWVVDALAGYNAARSAVKNQVLAWNKPNMKTLGFIVENLGTNSSNTAITVKITTQIGYGSTFTPNSQSNTAGDWGFTEDSQFWWQRYSWNCYNYNPETTIGAPEIIEGILMFGYIPAPSSNCRYVYPTIYVKPFNPIDYPVDQNPDLFCDYKIFYAKGTLSQILTDQVQCLGLDAAHPGVHEMAFYCTGLKQIIDAFLALPANTNYSCQKIFIDTQEIQQMPDQSNIYFIQHSPTLYYGVRQVVCNYPAWDITDYEQ